MAAVGGLRDRAADTRHADRRHAEKGRLARNRGRSGIGDVLADVLLVVDPGQHERGRRVQDRHRRDDAIGGRTGAGVDAGVDARQRLVAVERELMARRRPFALRRDDQHVFRQFMRRVGEKGQTRRGDAVVVGDQDAHWR